MYRHSAGHNPLIAREKRRLRRQRENTLLVGMLVVCLLCVLGTGAWWYFTRPDPSALLASLQKTSSLTATPLPPESTPTPSAIPVESPTQTIPTGVDAPTLTATPAPTVSAPGLWERIAGLFSGGDSVSAAAPVADLPEPTATYDPTGLEARELTAIIQASMTQVNGFLPNPNEASYPNMMEELDQWLISRANDVVTVQSYVDTEDEGGMKTRITFRLQMSYETGDLTYLELNNDPVYGSAVPIH